jgi:hypothetical protein
VLPAQRDARGARRARRRGTIGAEVDEDLDWDELLLHVRDGRVVPVIGSELFQVEHEGKRVSAEALIARDFATALKVQVPFDPSLRISDVALRFLQAHGDPRRLYTNLKKVLGQRPLPVPEPLRQLASIRELRLFLTTSCAPFVQQAIDQVRFGGRAETQVLAFSPYSVPGDFVSASPSFEACVYHIFGVASLMPDYVITDEDLIEFLHALQSDQRRPQNLFDYLRGRYLLFLGCGYANWLARFFIRTLRNERFASSNLRKGEIVVDGATRGDPDLVVFLRQYASQVFPDLGVLDFVSELHRRAGGAEAAPAAPPPAADEAAPASAMPAEAVFLSYAREDVEEVRAVAAALEQAGVDVWFDERKLDGGVDWDAIIQDNIRRCSVFVPFVSRTTAANSERYFWVEWRLAIKRAMRMAHTRPFIVPIAVDDVPVDTANVPPEFRVPNWLRLRSAGAAQIASELRKIVRQLRAPQFA